MARTSKRIATINPREVRDNGVIDIDGTSDQLKNRKLKKILFFYFGFEHVYLGSLFETF